MTKMLAEWFWTDRWMGSSAFLLPMEARGVYREMLSQAWRRGARLPADHDAIKRAIGATEKEWQRAWPKLEKFWRVDGDCLVNDTQLEVYAEAEGKRERAQARAQAGAQARAQAQRKQAPKHEPPSPSPTKQTTEPPPARAEEAESVNAECEALAADLVKALQRAKEVTGKDGAEVLAHSTVRGKASPITNPLACSDPARKLWKITTERVYGFIAAWEADQREALAKKSKRGGAPGWDRGPQLEADSQSAALAWVRDHWPADADPQTKADLYGLAEALKPPDALLGLIKAHLLFGCYPHLRNEPEPGRETPLANAGNPIQPALKSHAA